MKYLLTFLITTAMMISCSDNKPSEHEIEGKLKRTMKEHLEKNARPGTVATINDVVFDERDKYYYCEFKVNMKNTEKDTTGTMVALISKDFKTVERSQ